MYNVLKTAAVAVVAMTTTATAATVSDEAVSGDAGFFLTGPNLGTLADDEVSTILGSNNGGAELSMNSPSGFVFNADSARISSHCRLTRRWTQGATTPFS